MDLFLLCFACFIERDIYRLVTHVHFLKIVVKQKVSECLVDIEEAVEEQKSLQGQLVTEVGI